MPVADLPILFSQEIRLEHRHYEDLRHLSNVVFLKWVQWVSALPRKKYQYGKFTAKSGLSGAES